MARKKTCCDCGKALTKDEVGISRKLLDEDTQELYCLDCFAEYLGCTVDDLKIKISEFKEAGCTLFL